MRKLVKILVQFLVQFQKAALSGVAFLFSALICALVLSLGACVSQRPPVSELIYASAALKAAERSQAERKSPDLFLRAQNALWKANRLYLGKEFSESGQAAIDARRLAERAELDAELKNALSSSNSLE